MRSDNHRPQWQLPPGVTRGMWDYASSPHIADDYDNYFSENRLFVFDEQVLARYFTRPGLVADLGCGTGRALVPLVRRGFRGLAVDLSEEMLRVVEQKARAENLDIQCLSANLVELDAVPDGHVDYAICLFSTIGMIRGRTNRRQALRHVRRIVKPGGIFVLHVHNYWYNLYDPAGPWWLIGNLIRSRFDKRMEAGDKFFDYRGIPKMFLHVFTRGEIRNDLRRAGFYVREMIPLDPRRHRELNCPWLMQRLRANGWVIVCE